MNDIKRKITGIFGKTEDYSATTELFSASVVSIPCDAIRPNRSQPRADFNEDELFKLANSIKRYGIIQPLTVRRAESEDIYDYELISGERRLRAARLLSLYGVPCIIIEADEQASAELAIIENIMRSNLNMFETAYALRNLSEDYGLTQEEIARRMSMSQSAVANKIRLLRLSYEEQQAILSVGLTERHARALLRLDGMEERLKAIKHISDLQLNVKESELYIDGILRRKSSNTDKVSAEEPKLINQTADKHTKAVIRGIQKRIDNLASTGRQAGMNIEFFEEHIELHIKIQRLCK